MGDRSAYLKNRVGRQIDPTTTLDEPPFDQDSTERSAVQPVRPTAKRTARRAVEAPNWFRDHWLGVLGAVVTAGIIGLLAWALAEVFSLNREVGEMHSLIDSLKTGHEEEERAVDRINDRLDHLQQIPAKGK